MPKLGKRDKNSFKEMDIKARRRFVRTMKAAQEEIFRNTVRPDFGKERAKKILALLQDWAAEANMRDGRWNLKVSMQEYGRKGDNPTGARFNVYRGDPKKGIPRETFATHTFSGRHLANRKAQDVVAGIISNLERKIGERGS